MNERIKELAEQAAGNFTENFKWDHLLEIDKDIFEKFAELIIQDTHRKIISSILITDVIMEEHSKVPTSKDYIRAINKGLELSNE